MDNFKSRTHRCPRALPAVVMVFASILVVFHVTRAHAQTPVNPADSPQPPPTTENAGPANTDASQGNDPDDVLARYQAALDAFSQGRFAEAEALFRDISQRSQDPVRKSVAEEMARQAATRALRDPTGQAGIPPIPSNSPDPSERDNARVRLLSTTLLLGLNYGWMVPLILDMDDGRAIAGVYMLTAGASFVGPYLATRNTHVSPSMATLSGGGAVLGMGHGALLYLLAAGNDDTNSDDVRAYVGSMLAASLLEGAGGYLWAKRTAMNDGPANAAVSGAVIGAGVAAALDVLLLGEHVDDLGARGTAATILLGSGLGIAGGYYAGQRRRYSAGDVYIVETAGLLGTYLAATPLLLLEAENPRIITGTLLAGLSAGLLLGDRLVQGKEANNGQGALVALGTLAGGLVGAGVGFLVSPEDSDIDKWLITSSAIGATAGLGLIYRVVDIGEESPATTGPQLLGVTPWLGADDARGLGLLGRF